MRANFAADFHPPRARLAQKSHASSGADVLAMNGMIAELGEQNVAGDDHFFAGRRPSRQTEQSAPVAFVNDAVADEIVILTMIEHRDVDHARVLDGAAHELVILHTMT